MRRVCKRSSKFSCPQLPSHFGAKPPMSQLTVALLMCALGIPLPPLQSPCRDFVWPTFAHSHSSTPMCVTCMERLLAFHVLFSSAPGQLMAYRISECRKTLTSKSNKRMWPFWLNLKDALTCWTGWEVVQNPMGYLGFHFCLCQAVETLKTPVVSITFQPETRTPSTKTTHLAPLLQTHTPRTPRDGAPRFHGTRASPLQTDQSSPDKQSSQPKQGDP